MTRIPPPEQRKQTIQRLEELSRQTISLCIQCGKCSAGCSFSQDMDLEPHQIVHMAQLGMIDVLAECEAVWFCATCFTCVSRCPQAIDIAAIAEAVRMIRNKTENNEIFGPDKILSEISEKVPQQALVSLFRKFGC